MCPNTINRYIDAISRTRKGLKVLIVDDLEIEQLAFIETVQHYLPESTATAMDHHELEEELNRDENTYDLVILEEQLLLGHADRRYARKLRKKYPKAKLALFIDQQNLHQLQTVSQLSAIDILLTKSTTVEAIAEKLCLIFQEPK